MLLFMIILHDKSELFIELQLIFITVLVSYEHNNHHSYWMHSVKNPKLVFTASNETMEYNISKGSKSPKYTNLFQSLHWYTKHPLFIINLITVMN